MYYVAYEDHGPSRPCGQTVANTAPWKQLHVFNDYAAAREFLRTVEQEPSKLGRMRPKVTDFWSDEDVNVVHHNNTEIEIAGYGIVCECRTCGQENIHIRISLENLTNNLEETLAKEECSLCQNIGLEPMRTQLEFEGEQE